MSSWPAVVGLVLGLGAAAEPVDAQGARGPLVLREQNPVYQLFYVPTMEGADVVGSGRWSADLTFAYANIFEQELSPTHELLFDLERLGTSLTLRYGVTARGEVGARLRFQSSGGGILDPLIQGLHDAINISNGNRHSFPSGVHDVYMRERGGRTLYRAGPHSFSAEDLQLFGRLQLLGGIHERRALTLRVTAKLPTGSGELGTGRGDAALSLLARRSFDRWHFHGLVGATRLSSPEPLRHLTRDWAAFWGFAAERRLGASVSALAQLMGSGKYISGVGDSELDKRPLILGLGFAGGRKWAWQFAFVEDLLPNGPSVDFTIHFQLSTVWR